MTIPSAQAFAAGNKTFKINEDVILSVLKKKTDGATQQEVFNELVTGRDLPPEQIGAIYQQVSRELSNMAKEGLLDDSVQVTANSGGRTLYRVPSKKLEARKTKMEVLREENAALKEEIASLNERIDFLVMMRERDAERIQRLSGETNAQGHSTTA